MGKHNNRRNIKKIISLIIFLIWLVIYIKNPSLSKNIENAIKNNIENSNINNNIDTYYSIKDIPDYNGEIYITINNNLPYFEEKDYKTECFEIYSKLDNYGRCGVAYANICMDIMPKEERDDISEIEPTGWIQGKYDGKYLYNRCHLIGYQLAGENANELNLITGTRYFNVSGMLPFENQVDDYIEKNPENHVLYRVTPIFEDNNLLATGVQMEAYSVEDNGKGVCFNVFVYNIQPGINIDYVTGKNWKQ